MFVLKEGRLLERGYDVSKLPTEGLAWSGDSGGPLLVVRLRRYFASCGARRHALRATEVRAVRKAMDERFGRGAARAYAMAARLRYCVAVGGRQWQRTRHLKDGKREGKQRTKLQRLRKGKSSTRSS